MFMYFLYAAIRNAIASLFRSRVNTLEPQKCKLTPNDKLRMAAEEGTGNNELTKCETLNDVGAKVSKGIDPLDDNIS